MALYDSLYSLDQAYSPFTNNMIRPSGQKQGDFGKTVGGLGLSSLMSPQLQPGITSPFKKGDEELNQRPEGFISPMGGATMALEDYINPSTGETWTAPSGGWTAPEGWVVKRFLDQYGLEEATRRATEQRAKPRDYLEGTLPQSQPDLGLRPTVTLPSASPFLNTRPGNEGAPLMLPQQPQPERPAGASDQDWQGYLSAAEAMRKYRKESGDLGHYIGVGEGGYDRWKNQQVSLAANKEKYGPGYSGLGMDIGGVMTNVDKEGNALSTPMPGDVGYVPYGSRNNQPPTPTPTPTPMPGDVGYVPYGSRNNQPLVQGLAGGGPVGTLSFVELLQQIMEN